MRSCLGLLLVLASVGPASAQSTEGGSARVIWGPSGRLLAPGETTVTTYQLWVVPAVQVGITSRFQIGIGAPIYRGVLISPKVQLYSGPAAYGTRTDVAAGVAHAWLPGIGAGGYAYVATTFGTRDAAVTFTPGLVYDSAGTRKLMVSVGGERRLSPRVVWITDNYFAGDGLMAAGGFRITGPNKSVDLVLGWLITERGITPLPVLNIGWKY